MIDHEFDLIQKAVSDELCLIACKVSETTINTRTNYNGDTFTETNDKVFLLSEADVFGTQNSKTAEVKDYTLGKEGVIVPDSMRNAVPIKNPCSLVQSR